MKNILAIFGTRPEAIKIAPVVKELYKHPDMFKTVICVTGQHREMLDPVLNLFDIRPDYDLDIMKPGQDLFDVTANVLLGMREVLSKVRPDVVLVQGDTTTTLASSLAAFYVGVPVGHVEAGLRTWNKRAPFPEEINRKVASCIADLHFAPTQWAKGNLLREGVVEKTIWVTGNTVIDALLEVVGKLRSDRDVKRKMEEQFAYLHPERKLILVTGHRRENFGQGFENICRALAEIAQKNPDIDILYPVHLNPNVQEPVHRTLGVAEQNNIHLIKPVDYLHFVYLMDRAYLIITDSGGVQEEAPSLGKPVLVMRAITERHEAVEAGTVRVVGTDREKIVSEACNLLHDNDTYLAMSMTHNPYGDGKAAVRIVQACASVLKAGGLV